MTVERRETFDEIAELYDRARPRYPAELFIDLEVLAGLGPSSRVLEVGTGTGIATLPLAERGYRVVAVELGGALAAVAEAKLAPFADVELVRSAFEDWPLPAEPFDLVVSATAWHWIDPAVGYAKAAQALRPGGSLAIVRYHHVAGEDAGFFVAAQGCYEQFTPDYDPAFRLPAPDAVVPDTAALEASGLFEPPAVRTYLVEKRYSDHEYVDLLATFSANRLLAEPMRAAFLDCIGAVIRERFDGRIRRHFLHELTLAHKAAGENRPP